MNKVTILVIVLTTAVLFGAVYGAGGHFYMPNYKGTVSQKGWNMVGYDFGLTNYYPYASSVNVGSTAFIDYWNTSLDSQSAYTGDVNGDGKLEIVTAYESNILVYSGNGTLISNFTVPSASTSAHPIALTLLADVNHDGKDEIFVSDDFHADGSDHTYHLWIYEWNGTLLKTIVRSGGDSGMYARALVNLENGYTGIAVVVNAGYTATPRGLAIYNYSSGQQVWYYSWGPASGPDHIAMGDINSDGKIDFVASGAHVSNGGSGDGQGGNTTTTDSSTYAIAIDEHGYELYTTEIGGSRTYVSIADLNNDGKEEVVVFQCHDSYYTGTSHIYILNSSGNITDTYTGATPNTAWNSGGGYVNAIADINGDGHKEIITGQNNGTITVLSSTLKVLEIQSFPSGIRVDAINDVNGDGSDEIIANTGNTLYLLDSNLQQIWNFSFSGNIKNVIVSDVNGDGVNEIIVSTSQGLFVLGAPAGSVPELSFAGIAIGMTMIAMAMIRRKEFQ